MQTNQSESHHLEQLVNGAVTAVRTQMDYRTAISQLECAARAGHATAALFLSQLYRQGFRVERDSYKAQYWQNLARQTA